MAVVAVVVPVVVVVVVVVRVVAVVVVVGLFRSRGAGHQYRRGSARWLLLLWLVEELPHVWTRKMGSV